MNLQFRSICNKLCTAMHTNNKIKGKILVTSISRRNTSGSDLMKVVDGSGDTFRHLYTYKKKKKINTNFAFMQEKAKDGQGEWRELMQRVLIFILSMQFGTEQSKLSRIRPASCTCHACGPRGLFILDVNFSHEVK